MLWYSLEAPHRGASNEYPQYMFLLRNKKDISIFWMKNAPYLLLWKSKRVYMDVFSITKTRLFKYIENFTTKKKWKLSDKKIW